MYPHHEAAIERVIARFEPDPTILALLLGGSLAHGFGAEGSDVDIMLVVSDEEFAERVARLDTLFWDAELAGYDDGYIDGKYVSVGYLALVAERGSEPARFAFEGARVLFSRVGGLEQLLAAASRYPSEVREDRIARFAAQLEAWRWYCGEAAKKSDPYLLATSVTRLVLFGGRLLLAHNAVLYPFHKWFLRVLEGAPDKPEGVVELMRELSAEPNAAKAEHLADLVLGYREWHRGAIGWSNHFAFDTEQSWMRDAVAVDDL